MHFTIEQEDATTIFRLKEPRLDSLNASQLKAEFLILAQPDVETLIVDLSEVGYVDSAGLSALLLAERQQAEHQGVVRLVGVNDSVASLLRLTQLDRVFPTFNTIDEALDAEPSFGDDDDDESSTQPSTNSPVANALSGAISAGGSLGAVQMTNLIMGSSNGLYSPSLSIDDEDEDYDDDEDLYDDDDEDLDEVEEADVEGDAEELEEEDFEDEDFDEEEEEDLDEVDEDFEDYDEDEDEEEDY